MDCVANHSIFLRSNGTLACWCDYGSLKTLQRFDPAINYASDVYLGPVFDFIRDSLRRDQQPFPTYCSNCLVLAPQNKFTEYYRDNKIIDTLQVEPSMACQLDCPGCIPLRGRKERVKPTEHGHMILSIDVLKKILTDLATGGMRINKIDFQGHGEPLLCPAVWDMVAIAREMFPETHVSMCTNAHSPRGFRHEWVENLSEILFAIDGVDQPSYIPYRMRGNFDSAYGFMREFSHAARAGREQGESRTKTVWKYVLFDHNDADEQLLRAQGLAFDAGVDELRFIISQLGPTSTQIIDESQIPRANVPVNVVAVNYKVSVEQLDGGLAGLRDALAQGDARKAADSAVFVAKMLSRTLRTAKSVPHNFKGIYDDLIEMSGSVEAKSYREVAAELAGIVEKLPVDCIPAAA